MTPSTESAPVAPAAPAAPVAPVAPAAAGLRGAAVPLGVLGGVVAAFCYVGAVDPNTPGHYPVCPLLHYTGLYCPGCGGLRSAYAIAHGRFGTALGCNALAVAGYALFAVVWAVWFWRSVRGLPFRPAFGRAHRWAIWGLLIGFGVVRNLPFGSVLAP